MIMYECQDFAVTNGILRGLRIREKSTHSTIKPGEDISRTFFEIWKEMRYHKASAPHVYRVAERLAFHDLGCISLGLSDSEQRALFAADPYNAAREYMHLGAEQLTASG